MSNVAVPPLTQTLPSIQSPPLCAKAVLGSHWVVVAARYELAARTSIKSVRTRSANGGWNASLSSRSNVDRPCATLAPGNAAATRLRKLCATPDSKAEVSTASLPCSSASAASVIVFSIPPSSVGFVARANATFRAPSPTGNGGGGAQAGGRARARAGGRAEGGDGGSCLGGVATHLQDEANTPLVCQQSAEQLVIHRQDALVECVWHATPAACARAQ